MLAILDFLFPQACLGCFSLDVEKHHYFCPTCWKDLVYIRDPQCFICGLPFDFNVDGGNVNENQQCPSCNKNMPFYDFARSLFSYNDLLKKMILRFKNGDQTQYASYLGNLLFQNYKDFFKNIDCIIPVPLHKKKLLWRNFNQSALLANVCGGVSEKNVYHHILYREKNNSSQEHKTRKQRFENIEDIFSIKNEQDIKNKNILLIDDVMTTGATLDSCAKVLKMCGAKKVKCLSIARSVNGDF